MEITRLSLVNKLNRNWWPCRECGKPHRNPASSSTCAPCGAVIRENRLRDEAKQREAEEFSLRLRRETFERLHNIDLDELKELLG